MRNSVRANIELGAQIAIAIAVLVVSGVLVKTYLFPPRPNSARTGINAGEQLNLQGVDWKQNKKSLVFFLSKDCQYCTASAPFYRELIKEASGRGVTAMAVLPNSMEQSRAYLQSIHLPINDVRVAPLASYKIIGTPTILFVNSRGIVERVWVGAASGKEAQMRNEFLAVADMPVSAE